jgi:hypothetical protein
MMSVLRSLLRATSKPPRTVQIVGIVRPLQTAVSH